MTAQTQENQVQTQEVKQNDKELNFRALEAKLAQERAARLEAEKARLEAEKALQERSQASLNEEEDDNGEPYVDEKRLEKKLNRFGQSTKSEIQKAMESAKAAAKEELRQEMWLENNPDFYEVLQHANKFAEKDPALAKTILKMPDTFERQQLVYQNIKALGLHKPETKAPSIQEKIDANRKSPYYQPGGVAAAPYTSVGDFSSTGQKQAYEKMQELKNRLRI